MKNYFATICLILSIILYFFYNMMESTLFFVGGTFCALPGIIGLLTTECKDIKSFAFVVLAGSLLNMLFTSYGFGGSLIFMVACGITYSSLKRLKIFFNLVFFICLGLVCFLYYQMLVLETVNGDIFLDYGLSKNYPGSMLVIFNSLWAVWKYLHYKRMPLLLPILSTIMAFFLDGRSSLICMILITVLCFVDRGSKLTISLMILIFTFLLINYWGVITGFYELTSISSRGLETVRSDIWKAYFDYLDFSTLLFGLDTQNLPVLKEFGGNPHNSFFSFHRRMGLVGLCMLFYVLMKGFRALIKRRLYVVLYFNIVLLVRMFFDGMLMTAQDFFIFTLFFLPLSYNNKVFQIEDQLEKKGVNRLERLWDKFVFII